MDKKKFSAVIGCGKANGIMVFFPEIFADDPLTEAFMNGHVRRCQECKVKYSRDLDAYKEAREHAQER